MNERVRGMKPDGRVGNGEQKRRAKTKREGEMEKSSVLTLGSQVKERRGPASEAIFEGVFVLLCLSGED